MQNKHSNNYLPHEKLRVWSEVIELVKLVGRQRIRDAELRDQATRAVKSLALNVAEGANRARSGATNHFRIARGSAGEVAAAYQLAVILGESVDAASVKVLAGRVIAMLGGLTGRGG